MRGLFTIYTIVQIILTVMIVYVALPIIKIGIDAMLGAPLSTEDRGLTNAIIPIFLLILFVVIIGYVSGKRQQTYTDGGYNEQ